ncbi:MopE-related protein [Mangrovimonas spongiae]|uniref:T9SS C-terminal target domain-containing protein n=1 Tax=Mangrovimonas spongiae TaxID=2494697 RepID=A0A3R9NY89_9FLAO|nr:MopE-related protein [Mangrovimonas spongiae]RSK40257.1 T9SS C-terminal target domain-containing protein [Mangrovimonas spongiae]
MKKLLLLYCLLFTVAYSNAQGACEIISVTPYCESNDLCVTVVAYTEGIQNQFLVFEYENGDSQAHPIFSSGLYTFSICGQPQQSIVTVYVGGELDGTQCSQLYTSFLPSCSSLDDDGDGVTADIDCDDQDANIYPGAPEICDGKDNNCDGNTDEGLPTTTYYWDADLDGYGNPDLVSEDKCSHPGGRYVEIAGDCDDTNPDVNPGATEIVDNGIDDDCNPNTPDSSLDIDNDGDGQTENEGDCDDTNAAIYTGNTEIPYNGIDDDCDASTPDDDLDGDGYLQSEDCDDQDASVNPGATEIVGNGIDDDCNPDTPDTNDCILDSDNDGTPDCQDGCPNDRKKTEPGDCGCGTVDRDKDNDGIADCNDVCDREDDTVDVDNDGIPDCIDPCIGDQDSDGDGVADCNDICNGQDDTLDSDGDTVPDCLDVCPNDPNDLCNSNPCAVGETLICHYKNNGDTIEMCVRENQLQRHLDHGDTIGGCNTQARQAMDTEAIALYPNPNNGMFTLAFKNWSRSNETVTISVKNTYGLEVYRSSFSSAQQVELNLQNQLKRNGIYFVCITSEHATVTKRIIIAK